MPQAKNLSVSIHDEPVLDGLDLNVNTGEVAAIVGPNGSGMRKPIGIVLGGIAR